MTARDLFWTAWHNVGRRRVRTVLAAAGVTIGIIVLVAMLSLVAGVRREVSKQFSSIGLEWVDVRPGREGGRLPPFLTPGRVYSTTAILTEEVVEGWRQRPDIRDVRTTIWLPGSEYTFLRYGETVIPASLYQSALAIEDPFAAETQLIAGQDLRPGREGEIVLGQDVVLNLQGDLPVENMLGAEVRIELYAPRGEQASFPLTVVGITDAPYREMRIGVKDREKLKSWWLDEANLLEEQGYDQVALRAGSTDEAVALAEELEAAGYNVSTTLFQFEQIKKGLLVLEAMMGSIALLALLVAGIGIANTMVMAIYERTREIGLLKALGASRQQIRLLFVSESAAIGLLGGIAGLTLGWLISMGLNQAILAIFRWQDVPIQGTFFVTTAGLALTALLFGTLVGAVAGLIPSGRAARLDPVQALRYE